MTTYKLTAVNTNGALKIEVIPVATVTMTDFLRPEDSSVEYDNTNSVVNISMGAKNYLLTVANTLDSGGSPFGNFAALKTFIEGIFFLSSGSTAKIYRALLTQSGMEAPTVHLLENSLGETPTYSAPEDAGAYSIQTVGNVFTENKTLAQIDAFNAGQTAQFSYEWISDQRINIYSKQSTDLTGVNGQLLNNSFIILVYP